MLGAQRVLQGAVRRLSMPSSIAHYRGLSTSAAKEILGLRQSTTPSLKELRSAYFQAAKKCHPDTNSSCVENESMEFDEGLAFRRISDAYEKLLSSDVGGSFQEEEEDIITEREEEDYRKACLSVLGINAEIVEESKQDAVFRNWLAGNTNCAKWW
eukprot:CAMPEP_0194323320 /NCGR_PEP_ID=MMETSP0171-20130528/25176_1 /TAXON_ID=218684 /ORGANISM="Corethron pennatum, Strain L29A3" /LENGTH=155 /DNA_ID=CAMNT_0039081933 /DNA_START=72 /DNA_END=536 /DNA_ORIENTATION=+